MKNTRIGSSLVESGVLTDAQLRLALAEQKRTGGLLGEVLVELGLAQPAEVAKAVAESTDTRYLALSDVRPEEPLQKVLDERFCREKRLAAVHLEGRVLTVAMANPLDIVAVDKVRERSGYDVETVISADDQIGEFLDRMFAGRQVGVNLDDLVDRAALAVSDDDSVDRRELGPVIELVDTMIAESYRRRATDIHLEPESKSLRIRFRVDGVLQPGPSLPRELISAVLARIKILAGLDISETRLPQDGRIRQKVGRRMIDLRVSTIPTVNGENAVLRVLDKSNLIKGLAALGLAGHDLETLEQILATKSGMLLVTGPTGSGKTTTLYSSLATLDAAHYKIATLEDPVEYELPLIRQSQINERTGFGFSEGLRSLLRQDPDVVFVGEMRDTETSTIAVRAALTGHLVLSTLHTTSALSTLSRLHQMGISKDLICTSVRGILAQRLVRRICTNCAAPAHPDPLIMSRLGIDENQPGTWLAGSGCAQCSDTGYKGRLGLYEVVHFTHELSDAWTRGAGMGDLARIAAKQGTRFLRDAGLSLAAAGHTSLEDVLHATADTPKYEDEPAMEETVQNA